MSSGENQADINDRTSVPAPVQYVALLKQLAGKDGASSTLFGTELFQVSRNRIKGLIATLQDGKIRCMVVGPRGTGKSRFTNGVLLKEKVLPSKAGGEGVTRSIIRVKSRPGEPYRITVHSSSGTCSVAERELSSLDELKAELGRANNETEYICISGPFGIPPELVIYDCPGWEDMDAMPNLNVPQEEIAKVSTVFLCPNRKPDAEAFERLMVSALFKMIQAPPKIISTWQDEPDVLEEICKQAAIFKGDRSMDSSFLLTAQKDRDFLLNPIWDATKALELNNVSQIISFSARLESIVRKADIFPRADDYQRAVDGPLSIRQLAETCLKAQTLDPRSDLAQEVARMTFSITNPDSSAAVGKETTQKNTRRRDSVLKLVKEARKRAFDLELDLDQLPSTLLFLMPSKESQPMRDRYIFAYDMYIKEICRLFDNVKDVFASVLAFNPERLQPSEITSDTDGIQLALRDDANVRQESNNLMERMKHILDKWQPTIVQAGLSFFFVVVIVIVIHFIALASYRASSTRKPDRRSGRL